VRTTEVQLPDYRVLVFELASLRLLAQCPLHRGAYCFVGTMNAAYPAAGAAFALGQFLGRSFDMFVSGFLLLDGHCPANPFITCQGGNIFPSSQRFRVRHNGFLQISWQVVNHTTSKFGYRHTPILSAGIFLSNHILAILNLCKK
jgi:hypothetical protein